MKTKLLPLLVIFIFCSTFLSAQITGGISVCENEITTYYAPSSAGASYTWNQVGGSNLTPLNSDSLIIQWGTAGTGSVVVLVNGVPSSLSVTINPKPMPKITYDAYPVCFTVQDSGSGFPIEISCVKVCKNATVTYSTTLKTGSTYQWKVSGESSITGTTTNAVTVTWDNTNYGNITVIETNSFGCLDSSTFCVEKLDLPVASFTNLSNVCKSASVSFNNLSTGATSYKWLFGDGVTSTAFSPTHSYSSPGNYTITLITENECFCTDTFQNTITVNSLPGPEISCPSTLCAGDTATYTATGDISCTYNWFSVGGTIISGMGTPSVTVAWGVGQLGTLGLSISGCSAVCSDTTLVYIPIIPAIGSISGLDIVCEDKCYTFSLPPMKGSIFNWSLSSNCYSGTSGYFSNATNCEKIEICWPQYSYGCIDTLRVTYYNEFLGCSGVAEKIIKVRPSTGIQGDQIVCVNSTSYFNESNYLNSNWTITPSGPTISPANPTSNISINWNNLPGIYTIKAIVNDPDGSCNDSSFYQVTVVAPPAPPSISGDTIICANSTSSYCTVSTDIVHWIITGGTPSTAIGNCVNVTWGATGPYLVEAFVEQAESPNCLSGKDVLIVNKISASPPALTGNLTPCANSTTLYSTTTIYPLHATFNWSMTPANAGAILSGSSSSTAIEWGNNAPGTIVVNLEVIICNQIFNNSINVALSPIPATSVTQTGTLCPSGNAQLSATGGTSYSWNGPSGFTSTSNPTTISNSGLYQVVVTDVNGCQTTDQITVSPVSGPNARISSGENLVHCIGSSYTDTLCALGNPNYSYLWSNGATTQCITVSTVGSYSVLITDNSTNCTQTSNTLVVSEVSCTGGGGGGGGGTPCVPLGFVSFTNSLCNPIVFTNTSVNASNYSWNFGNGNTSALTSPTHSYSNAGFYRVTLSGVVPDTSGTSNCTLTASKKIEIPMAANFDQVIGCAYETVCFVDRSTYTFGNNITSWGWNFGDGNSSSIQNPCHLYSTSGSFTVVLTISNGNCITTYTKTITVAPSPNAVFSAPSIACLNTPNSFTDASTGGVTEWSWTFGNGGTSLNQNPTHGYNTAGNKSVQLLVKNAMGCIDSATSIINIVAPAFGGNIAAFPDTVVCEGNEILLVAPSCATCSYLWSTGSTNDSVLVSATGIYLVTITDANGCNYYTSKTIIVKNNPSVVIQNFDKKEFCLGEFASLYTTYNTDWNYLWITPDINNGTIYSSIFVNPVATGTYNYQLEITDILTGCKDTGEYSITVHPNPVPPVITSVGPSVICTGGEIKLVATHPDPTVSFLWNTGEVNDTIIVTKSGCYELKVTNLNGCESKSSFCVTVNPLPEVCSFYEGCFDTCSMYEIKGPAGASAYQWMLNGNAILGATSQNYTANVSGDYSVSVTSSFGCIDTTGVLALDLYPCPDTLCADLIIDSIYCDSAGDYVMTYHVINSSALTVSQINLQILPPFDSVPAAPLITNDSVISGDSSKILTTVIYGSKAGDSLCFKAHVIAYDSLGRQIMCCFTDTQCVVLPPCNNQILPCNLKFTKDICENNTSNFAYQGSTTGFSLNWSFPGGSPATASGAGPHSILYSTPGAFPISLTSTNGSGGTNTCTDSISVHPNPVANIVQTGSTLYAYPSGMNYQWYSGAGMIILPGETNQFFTPTNDKGDRFCVIVTSPNNCKDTFCINYKFAGLENLSANSIVIYPNPNHGLFDIDIDAVKSENITISVVNIYGVLVYEDNFSVNTGTNKLKLQNEKLEKGVYLLRIEDENGSDFTVRMVVM